MVSPERGCTPEEGNCGSPLAMPYFVSFQLVGTYVFLNMVIAVILEHFGELANERPEFVTTADLELFREVWADKFDPDGDGMMPASDLPSLVLALPPPLGLRDVPGFGTSSPASRRSSVSAAESGTSAQRRRSFSGAGKAELDAVARHCKQLEVAQPIDGMLRFHDVLDALVFHTFKTRLDEGELQGIEDAVKNMPLPVGSPAPERLMRQASSRKVEGNGSTPPPASGSPAAKPAASASQPAINSNVIL